ncbi:MAG: type I-D CRISPR-associated helicase Cas3' [bacterium]
MSIKILPRYVKQINNIRPFQKDTIEKIIGQNSPSLLFVEAPVGAGKSHIIRRFIEQSEIESRPLILCYPTKILMESQIASIANDLEKVTIWPNDDFLSGNINIFMYTSDTIIEYLSRNNKESNLDRTKLIQNILNQLTLAKGREVIVTSPDVLFGIMVAHWYRQSTRIQSYLKGAIVVFDEFHVYASLENFTELIKGLQNTIARNIVCLSATPVKSSSFSEFVNEIDYDEISFQKSIGNEQDVKFNYPLDFTVHSYRYTDIGQTIDEIVPLLEKLPKPCAVIFDSIFRLKHIYLQLPKSIKEKFNLIEWHGMKKDKNTKLTDKDIVLGTSSIEVGIDMKFQSLIFEGRYWTSAIQRLGRVGRFSGGTVHFLTKIDFNPYLKSKTTWDRTEFEIEILREALKDPDEAVSTGLTFRGDNYNFLLHDVDSNEWYSYNESLFSMYEVHNLIDDWKTMDSTLKKRLLSDLGFPSRNIDKILLRDRVFPYWGIIEGHLKNDYSKIYPKYDHDENILEIRFKDHDIYYEFFGDEI